MTEMRKYDQEVKPPMLSPRIDIRFKKKWDVGTDDEGAGSFKDELAEKLENIEDGYADLLDKEEMLAKKEDLIDSENRKNDARILASRQVGKMMQGLGGFVPREIQARVEQTKDNPKFNFELVDDEDYRYYPDYLVTPFYDSADEAALASTIFSERTFLGNLEELPGEGTTMPHNMSMLKGFDIPFKKEDKDNYESYLNDAAYAALHTNFMSPRNILSLLDPNMFQRISSVTNGIRETRIPEGMDDLQAFRNPYVSEDDGDLNWENAPDPYADDDIESFDINANYHTILMSQMWVNWSSEQVFSFINSAWESRTRAEDVLREIFGKQIENGSIIQQAIQNNSQGSFVDSAEPNYEAIFGDDYNADITAESDPVTVLMELLLEEEMEMILEDGEGNALSELLEGLEEEDIVAMLQDIAEEDDLDLWIQEVALLEAEIKAITEGPDALSEDEQAVIEQGKVNAILDKAQDWWDRIGSELDESMILPYGVLSSLAPVMSTMMEWGNWAEDASEKVSGELMADSFGFKDKMIGGYLDYIQRKFLEAAFFGYKEDKNEIKPDFNNEVYLQGLLTKLQDAGYLDKFGKVSPDFDLTLEGHDLEGEFTASELALIMPALRKAALSTSGQFALVDNRLSTNPESLIKLKCDDGNYRNFNDILNLVNSGDTALDKISNAETAYNTLFNLYLNITGLNETNSVSGDVMSYGSGDGLLLPELDMEYTEMVLNEVVTDEVTGEKQFVYKLENVQGMNSVEFASKEELGNFIQQVRAGLALLEPVVGTFAKREEGEQFYQLIDNMGSADSVGMLTEDDPNYNIQVDAIFNPEFFQTQSWEAAAKFLEKGAIDTIKDSIFTKSQMNKVLRMSHEQKSKDYKERKAEFEEEEYERVKSELRKFAERRKNIKRLEKQAAIERKKKEQAYKLLAIRRAKERRGSK
jgi:hypothetical protein